jgi:hypothetical protein
MGYCLVLGEMILKLQPGVGTDPRNAFPTRNYAAEQVARLCHPIHAPNGAQQPESNRSSLDQLELAWLPGLVNILLLQHQTPLG